MEKTNPDARPVEGQGNELNRGARNTSEEPVDRDEAILDDEYARPPHDRSPLT